MAKTKKKTYQLLIHQINPETYNKVKEKAGKEKRSLGKTAELILESYFEEQQQKD